MYYILKNYNGENLDEFFEQLKRFKAIPVGENGDVKTETQEVPTEARSTFLALTEKLIYKFGMGVNPDDLEGTVTNVRIRALFSLLDLKANDFEAEVDASFNALLWFLNAYYEVYNPAMVFEPSEVKLTFNRSMVINEKEQLESLVKQKGIISDKTLLENHPMVDNVEEEMERLAEELGDLTITDLEDDLEDDMDNE
jgi:SPP1 family phage portal protein